MNFVLAYIKSRNKQKYKKLLSEQTLYPAIKVNSLELVTYSFDHNLDDDSYFCIDKLRDRNFCLEILKHYLDPKDYNNISKQEFTSISYIISVENNNYFFQKITPAAHIRKKMISMGDNAVLENIQNRIIVREEPDAIYIPDRDCLLFKKISVVNSIFKGIDQLYKEATKEQVEEFLLHDFLKLTSGFNTDKVTKLNRRRIALAIEKLQNMSHEDTIKLFEYIKPYCNKEVNFDENKKHFCIASNSDLKNILYGIRENFYTTPFSNEQRLANSVKRL